MTVTTDARPPLALYLYARQEGGGLLAGLMFDCWCRDPVAVRLDRSIPARELAGVLRRIADVVESSPELLTQPRGTESFRRL